MSIRLHNHWMEECKGTQLSLSYDKGQGFKAYLTPCHRRSPDPKEGALLDIMAGKSQMLLPCKRTSAKVEAEAITLFEQLIQAHIESNPIIVAEKLVINVGDRFFEKSSHFHWDCDKTIVILSVSTNFYYGLSDVAIEKGKFQTRPYNYAEVAEWDRLEPMSESDLKCLLDRKVDYENDLKAIADERSRLIEVGQSLVPSWAVAAIVAKLEKDTSDSNSDYHGSETTDYRVLSFSRSKKNDFKEMRKAASEYGQTAFLDNSNCENREDYSMGHGYYLANSRYSGWQVSKSVHLGSSDFLLALGKYGLTKGIEPVKTVETTLNPEPISDPQPESLVEVEAIAEVNALYEPFRIPLNPEPISESVEAVEAVTASTDEPVKPFNPEHVYIDGVLIDRNEEKNCIEIKFSENPSSPICAKLIGFGFRRVTAEFWCNNQYSIDLFDAIQDSLTVD